MSTKIEAKEYLHEQIEELIANIDLNQFSDKAQWAKAHYNYGNIAIILAEKEKNAKSSHLYEEAIRAFKKALRFYQQTKDIKNETNTTLALSRALRYYATYKCGLVGACYLKKAEKLLKNLEYSLKKQSLYKELVILKCEHSSLLRDYIQIGPKEQNKFYLKRTIHVVDSALKLLRKQEDYANWLHISIIQANLYVELSYMQNKTGEFRSLKRACYLFKNILKTCEFYENTTQQNYDFSYEKYICKLEIAFIYARLANKNYSQARYKYYITKGLYYFDKSHQENKFKISKTTFFKIYKEQGCLLLKLASEENTIEKKIPLLVQAVAYQQKALDIQEHYPILKEKLDNYNALAKCFSSLAFFYDNKEIKKEYAILAIESLHFIIQNRSNIYYKTSYGHILDLLNNLILFNKISNNKQDLVKYLPKTRQIYNQALMENSLSSKQRLSLYKKLYQLFFALGQKAKNNDNKLYKLYLLRALFYLKKAQKLDYKITAKENINLTLKICNILLSLAEILPENKKYKLIFKQNITKILHDQNLPKLWHKKAFLLNNNSKKTKNPLHKLKNIINLFSK